MSVSMELHKIIINELLDQQVIVLKEVDGERTFPIFIGTPEAAAIERRLKSLATPRPLTHELLASVIEALGAKLDHVEIHHLEGHTFYAKLHLRHQGGIVTVDSRPSDAIALSAGMQVPIRVSDAVLNEVC